MRYCHCRQCNKARRRGLILGTRLYGNYLISAYVPYFKFSKGRTRKEKNLNVYDL